jgi:hypothetical protein
MSSSVLPVQLFDTSDSDEAKKWHDWMQKYGAPKNVSYLAWKRHAAHEELENAISAEDALRIDFRSVAFAFALIDALPWWAPSPEVSVDPDGEILLDWDYGVRSVFSVSISPYGKLSFAGIFGASTRSGAETFTGEIPAAILEGIDAVAKDDAERLA